MNLTSQHARADTFRGADCLQLEDFLDSIKFNMPETRHSSIGSKQLDKFFGATGSDTSMERIRQRAIEKVLKRWKTMSML